MALGLPAVYSDQPELVDGLKTKFTGTHEVAGRRIAVKAVNVYSQPVGGMASLAYTRGLMTRTLAPLYGAVSRDATTKPREAAIAAM